MMFDDLFDDFFFGSNAGMASAPAEMMRSDITEFEDRYELTMDLPGFAKEDIKAELKDGMLTIRAERKAEAAEGGKLVHSERFAGTCQRSFQVGRRTQREDIGAAFENGVLKLSIRKPQKKAVNESERYIAID